MIVTDAVLGSPATGLTSAEAGSRLAVEGPNEWARDQRRHGLRIFLSQFASPLVLVLILAALISRVLGERTESVVILATTDSSSESLAP